ncbi:LOC51668 protein, putative [Trichomonas vaginalis G3]|uniref:LOC51668 protein, putative n=1 Tax=Trichomonas vaginalis (strain ATCC PRA-98 / G3) TaxID=412133 RepID=A2E0A1_TRIV3|nr:intraflagellar transport protein 25-like protein family [Trichomonas vaginalis G3]EAY13901.1 LOC51668 protein, putative [Trichomonas vaginalis G3]KAI5520915.1 intraflagellar transport protein 25-like protein family [Trichomonas vaginalis G3]|eukprot:XP_001326124.1 LOC51668 protein [Trichomonas vaginalis G3]
MASVIPLELFYATSMDVDHPASNVVDADETTFWTTTGLFPQECVLKFKTPAQIIRVTTITGKVKAISLYASTDADLTQWIEIDTYNLPAQPIKQQETHQLNLRSTTYGIKVVVNQGWGPFTALYVLRVEGVPVHEQPK